MTTRTGKCLCGAVKFSAEVVSENHSVCHCSTCRRWCGGGPFFAVRTRSVTFEGDDSLARYASSDWAERGFCKGCGTTLFYFLKPASAYMMSVGSFDDHAPFKLASEIFVDDKPDGYAFAGDHPRLTGAEAIAKFAGKSS
jgi:hypothetical protein